MNSQATANPQKRQPLSVFRALAVADVHGSRVKLSCCQRRADAGVHAATEQNHRARCIERHVDSIPVRRPLISLAEFLCVPSCPLWLKASTTKNAKVHKGNRSNPDLI